MKSRLAVVGFVLGLVSFLQLFGLEKAILAIVLSALGLREIATGELRGKNYAYGGIVLGSLYIIVVVILLVLKGPEMAAVIGKLAR